MLHGVIKVMVVMAVVSLLDGYAMDQTKHVIGFDGK